MKVFWSWQSDIPGKISRHFVREALEDAITALKEDISIEEPEREQLHLDHDRKGLPGSPDLANAILQKIRASNVFVADVTPVGNTTNGKSLMNVNVAIELGYALALIGDSGLLMILNSAYGDRDTLPFDLKHKAGPIIYTLSENATRKQIQAEKVLLVGRLKVAIRDCVESTKRIAHESSNHIEIPPKSNCAMYFDEGEVLARRAVHGSSISDLRYRRGALLYLRVIPEYQMPELRESEIADLIYGIKIRPLNFGGRGGGSHERNKYGGLTFSLVYRGNEVEIRTSSQLFKSREIWGLDSTPFDSQLKFINVGYEKVLINGLPHYLQFIQEHLNLKCPIIIEAGASNVEDFYMGVNGGRFERQWGPIMSPEIKSRHTIGDFGQKTINETLLAILEDLFDATGSQRPENLNGFPIESKN